jgi:hypothetical protein
MRASETGAGRLNLQNDAPMSRSKYDGFALGGHTTIQVKSRPKSKPAHKVGSGGSPAFAALRAWQA